jgi:hypothetical protein
MTTNGLKNFDAKFHENLPKFSCENLTMNWNFLEISERNFGRIFQKTKTVPTHKLFLRKSLDESHCIWSQHRC